MKEDSDLPKVREVYSDKEINELAEWAESLTIKQLFFLKESLEAFLAMEAFSQVGSTHVH